MPPPPPEVEDVPTDDDSAPTAPAERRATARLSARTFSRAPRPLGALDADPGGSADAAAPLALGNRAACLLRLERPREAPTGEALKQRAPAISLFWRSALWRRMAPAGEEHGVAAFACCVEALYVRAAEAAARRLLADVRKAPESLRTLRPGVHEGARRQVAGLLRPGNRRASATRAAYFDALERRERPTDAVARRASRSG